MAYDIGPRIGIEGEAKFRKSIRDVNASLKAMDAEMKAVTSSYKEGDQSQEKLRKQSVILNKQVVAQKTKLKELSDMLAKSTEKYGVADEKTQKWQRAVNEATTGLNQLDRELENNAEALINAEKANTELAKAERKAEEAAEELKKKEQRLATQVDLTSDKLNKSSDAMKTINKNALLAGAALGALGFASAKVGSNFEAQMSRVASISGASAENMEQLNAKAKEMGENTQFSASTSGKALEYMAMAGWKTEQMVDGLAGVINLAAASGEDLGLVSDIMTDSLTAFKLEASDSAHFADVLAKASSSANTNVAMMGETFTYAAPVAGALGYSVEDVAVAVVLMGNAGIKGEKSGTALRGMLTNLAKPTKQAKKYLEKLEVSLTDTSGEVRPLNDLLVDLRGGFANLIEAQKAEYAAGIAGKNAMSGMLALMNGSDTDFKKLTKAINNSSGAAEEMAKVTNDNLRGELKLLGSAAEGVGIAFYEKFDKQASNAVEKLTGKVSDFSSELSSGDLDGKMKTITATAGGVTTAIIALNATLAVRDLQNFSTAMSAGKTAMDAYKSATIAGTVAQKAHNLAVLASPWGWAAILIGSATTALLAYKAMTHESSTTVSILNDKIKDLNIDLDEQISKQNELADSRSGALGDVNTEINLISGYIDELGKMTDANGKVIDGYKDRAEFLTEQINTLIPNAISVTNDEAGAYYKVADSIDAMLFAKKKEMVLAAWEQEYTEALKNRAAAVDKVREATEQQGAAQDEVDRLRQESLTATASEQEALAMQIVEAERVLQKSKETTDAARKSQNEYNKVVSAYDATLMADEMDELNAAVAGFSKTLVKATGDNKAELEKAVVDAKTNLDLVVAEHGKAWNDMTEEQRRQAKTQVTELKTLLDQQITEAKRGGLQLPESFGKGITQSSGMYSDAMNAMIANGKKTVETTGATMEDLGYSYTVLFAEGIDSGKPEIEQTGENATLGLAEGMGSKKSEKAIWNTATNLAEKAILAMKEKLDIHSPSRVMRDEVGVMVSRGVAVGIDRGILFAKKATQKLGDKITDELSSLHQNLAEMEEDERRLQAEKELADHKKRIADKYEELGELEGEEKQKVLDEIAKLQEDWNAKQAKSERDAAKLALKEKVSALEEFKREYD